MLAITLTDILIIAPEAFLAGLVAGFVVGARYDLRRKNN